MKMKIRTGGRALGQEGEALVQEGTPPSCNSFRGNTKHYVKI